MILFVEVLLIIYPTMDMQEFSLLLVGIICLIILYSFIGNLFEHKNWHFVHETGAGIIIGFLFGTFMYYVLGQKELQFNQEIFFYGLLPPMIFAGGYNLKKKDFGKNLLYIITYAVLGTIVSFGITFTLTYLISQLHWIQTNASDADIETLETALIVKYSATISASDSVASLTLIKASEFPKLFSIIFGQGLVNDAVAIILYKVVGGLFDEIHGDMSAGQVLKTVLGSFFGTVFVSIIIGVVTAMLCSFIFKKCRFLVENQVTQVAFTYIFGILSYVMAQFFDMSGVITVMVSGVMLAHYNYYNLTVGGMHATTVTFQTVSFLAQACVFVYLGVSTIYYFINEVISIPFLLLQLAVCIISRCINIFGLNFIFKRCVKKWRIRYKDLTIVAVGGTIRGSVAFALILTIQANKENQNQVSVIKSTTLGLVCFTTIVLGGLMPKIIKCVLGDEMGKATNADTVIVPEDQEGDNRKSHQIPQSEKRLLRQEIKIDKKDKKPSFFKYSDQNYWRPFLIYKYQQRREIFKLYKKIMKYNSRQEYQGGLFYLLDLVEVDYSVLHDYVAKIEEEEQKEILEQIQEQPSGQDSSDPQINDSQPLHSRPGKERERSRKKSSNK